MTVTNQNLIVADRGGKSTSQRHLPIFKDADGAEYVSLDGHVLRKISDLNLPNTRREIVVS
jgi:hypothetical protein